LRSITATPRSAWNHYEASYHKPLLGITVMAKCKHTENHQKFTWRFLTLGADSEKIIQIIAGDEPAARQQAPCGMVAIFIARLPAVEVSHVC
ncbi:host cell division inhibitor Icd-like protein, partial [Citrobacter portucalensis]|uniref:host cell division inhibitor Icd-like protein n=1 Tax=Citrobacter portucalensis TaxID=1639133 RepID=UPI00226B41BE